MSRSTHRLLVLDADEGERATLAAAAEEAGFEAVLTDTLEAFTDELETARPSVVAIDLNLSAMDGIEVVRHLAGRGYEGMVIITSHLDRRVLEAARQSALAHGLSVDALQRPLGHDAVRDTLARTGRSTDEGRATPARLRSDAGREVRVRHLARALDARDLRVVYQPKVHCESGAVVAFEALARWYDPVLGDVGPNVFVPLAEAGGLIDRLTDVVFREALSWFGAHFGGTSMQLCLNLSARSLVHVALADAIEARCRETGVDPAQVVIELTETSSVQDQTAARDVVTRLRIKGFSVALDDLGSGHSSLVQLARQPFSELKIDRAFVRTSATAEDSRTIVRAIVGLARSLDMRVTAEGVEDQAAFDTISELGCDLMQGNFVGPPMEGDDVLEWVEARLPLLRRGGRALT